MGSGNRGGIGSGTGFHPTAWRCGIPAVVRKRRIKTIADWSDDDDDNGGDGDGDGGGGRGIKDADWLDEDGEMEGEEREEEDQGEQEAEENEEEEMEEEAGEEGEEVEGSEEAEEAEEEEQDECGLEGLKEQHVGGCERRRKRRRVIGSEEEEEQEGGKGVGEDMGEEGGGRVRVQEAVGTEGAGREEQVGTRGGSDDVRDADDGDRDADTDDSMMTQPDDEATFSLGLEGWDEEAALGDGQGMSERDGQQGAAEKDFESSQRKVETTVGDGEVEAKREAWEGKNGAVGQRVAVKCGGERCRDDSCCKSETKVKVEVPGVAVVDSDFAGSGGGAAATPELAAATPSPSRLAPPAAATGTSIPEKSFEWTRKPPLKPATPQPEMTSSRATETRMAFESTRKPPPKPWASRATEAMGTAPTIPRLPQTWFRADSDEDDIEDTPPGRQEEGEAGEGGEAGREGEEGEEKEERCGEVEGLRRRLFCDEDEEGGAADVSRGATVAGFTKGRSAVERPPFEAPQTTADGSRGDTGAGFTKGQSSVVQPPGRFTDALRYPPSTQAAAMWNGAPRPGTTRNETSFAAPQSASHAMQHPPSAQAPAVSDPMQRAPPTHTPAATPVLSDSLQRPISTHTPATPALSEATRQLLQRRLPHLQLVGWLEERGCDANGDPVFIDYRHQFGVGPSGADAGRKSLSFLHATEGQARGNENEDGCCEVGGFGSPWPEQPACAAGGGIGAGNGGAMGGRDLGWQQQLFQQKGGSGRRRGSGGGGGGGAAAAGGGAAAGSSGGHWVSEGGKKVRFLHHLCSQCCMCCPFVRDCFWDQLKSVSGCQNTERGGLFAHSLLEVLHVLGECMHVTTAR
ncbi:unnamed protein product [Closterium sp. Yama58-4]|nr:unnamed protein product [Closterium sp. Yama58-4]